MSSVFGHQLKLSLFGESHGPAVGMTLDGFPAGFVFDPADLAADMARRAPGTDDLVSSRREPDEPEILSGVLNGRTTGQPITCIIRNRGQQPEDYGDGPDLVRPGHGDYTAHVRCHGYEDWRGGGHLSGRLTAPLVFAGALCAQYLARQGVTVGAHAEALGGLRDRRFTPGDQTAFPALRRMRIPVLTDGLEQRMAEAIRTAKADGDSLGGVVECMACGLPAGLGAPFFDSVESQLAHLLFSIPAVKGVEFGEGFGFASMRGGEANDPLRMLDGRVDFRSNHSGGVQAGITNGMPLVFRLCVRPTPTIRKTQQTVSLRRMENAELTAAGRHDPCILPRVIPVVEAAAALVLLDLWKERAQCFPAE